MLELHGYYIRCKSREGTDGVCGALVSSGRHVRVLLTLPARRRALQVTEHVQGSVLVLRSELLHEELHVEIHGRQFGIRTKYFLIKK